MPFESKTVIVPTAGAPPAALDYETVAEGLGVSKRTLMRWIKQGCLPSPYYRGSTALFPIDYVTQAFAVGVCLPGTYEVAHSPRSEVQKPKPGKVAKSRSRTTKPKPKPKAKGSAPSKSSRKGGAK